MLDVFKGEFFIHPAALDYSGNVCSNNCAYCFASMRSEDRRASVKKLIDLCLGKASGKTLADWLFNQGYPVCISNRSDPFATSNENNTPQILQAMDLVPNGIFFQTKGGRNDMKMLDAVKKENVVMYITISAMREEISKRVEPGAMLPRHRIELAKYAKARGWEVIIGLNPMWKPWISEAEIIELEDELKASGIDRYLMMPLSMNAKDLDGMNKVRRARMPDVETADACSKDGEGFAFWKEQFWRMTRKGLRVFSLPMVTPCHMDDDACTRLGKHMNSIQHWTDFAYDEFDRSGKRVFTFSDFLGVMTKGNDDLLSYRNKDCFKYILCCNRALWKQGGLAKTADSFVDVYRVCWNEDALVYSPRRKLCFTTLADKDGKPVRDDYGDIQLVFCGRDDWRRERKPLMTVEDLAGKGVRL